MAEPTRDRPRDRSLPTLFAEQVNEVRDTLGPRVAAHMRPVLGNQAVKRDEQRRMFWQVADDWSAAKEAGLRERGLSDVDVALVKYPWREALVRAGGRTTLPEQVRFAQEMAGLGPPEPEPLEALAQRIAPPDPAPAAPPEPVAMPPGAGADAVSPAVAAAVQQLAPAPARGPDTAADTAMPMQQQEGAS